MATLPQIVQFSQQPSPLVRGLGAVAQGAKAIGDARRRQEKEQQAENRQRAYQMLGQAFSDDSDDSQTTQLIEKARELAPDLVFEVENMMRSQDAKNQALTGKSSIEREKLDLRKLELQARELDRQLKEETNELKRSEIKNKITLQEQKINQAKKEAETGERAIEASRKSTIDLVDRMLSHPGLESAVGTSSVLPTLPGGDAADFEALLETLKGRQFLTEVQKMQGQGSLSDAEGKKIAAAAEALSLTQSEGEFKRSLQRIKDGLATAREPGTYSKTENSPAIESESEDVIMWDDL